MSPRFSLTPRMRVFDRGSVTVSRLFVGRLFCIRDFTVEGVGDNL